MKILIITPTYEGKEYVLDYWAKRIQQIIKHSPIKTDFLIVDNSKTTKYAKKLKTYGFNVKKIKRQKEALHSLANARKLLIKEAIKEKYDYVLSIEQDVIPPKNIIKKLLTLRKRIKEPLAVLGAPYLLGRITKKIGKKHQRIDYLTVIATGTFYYKPYKAIVQNMLELSKMPKKKLMKCYGIGYGCTLFDTDIFKKVPIRYKVGTRKPDDSYFYADCKKENIPVYSANKLMKEMQHFKGSTLSQESW